MQRQNDINSIIPAIKQFMKTLQGDPAQKINEIMSSGRATQDMLNQAQERAKPIYQVMRSMNIRM